MGTVGGAATALGGLVSPTCIAATSAANGVADTRPPIDPRTLRDSIKHAIS